METYILVPCDILGAAYKSTYLLTYLLTYLPTNRGPSGKWSLTRREGLKWVETPFPGPPFLQSGVPRPQRALFPFSRPER